MKEYRSARVFGSYEKDGVTTVSVVNELLAEWSRAGWELHSQSITTYVKGGMGMYGSYSDGEIVMLVFQRDVAEPA